MLLRFEMGVLALNIRERSRLRSKEQKSCLIEREIDIGSDDHGYM